jgi:hypothetical protein
MGAIIKAKAEQDARAKRDQFFTDTGNRLTSMQKQLDELTAFQKQRQARRADRRQSFGGGGAATIGQQMGASGLRISKGGMAPSARRRMFRAG